MKVYQSRSFEKKVKRFSSTDLMREIYVREVIERGLADSNAGRTKEVREVSLGGAYPPEAGKSPSSTTKSLY
jgi:hypothetical protein